MTNFVKETRKSSIHKKIIYNVKFNFFIKDIRFLFIYNLKIFTYKKYRLLAFKKYRLSNFYYKW